MSKNICQYWVDEPVVCSQWDDVNQTCGYQPQAGSADQSLPSRYPICNIIGCIFLLAACVCENKTEKPDLNRYRSIVDIE